jgi:hypothetical protein
MSSRSQRYKKSVDAVAKLHRRLATQEAKLCRLHEEREVGGAVVWNGGLGSQPSLWRGMAPLTATWRHARSRKR